MFFAERIKSIAEGDRVLEVGPGADPHPRSDVLLERSYQSETEYHKQLGHSNPLVTEKKVVYFEGARFPFDDNEFDYVICSHVLEHVDSVPAFLSELFRVAGKGYVEYPLVYYEYLYCIPAHQNVLKLVDGELLYMKKHDLPFEAFKPIQEFMLQSLQHGHVKMINDLLPYFIEGYEWSKPFRARPANGLKELTWNEYSLPWPPSTKPESYSISFLAKQLIRKFVPNQKMR